MNVNTIFIKFAGIHCMDTVKRRVRDTHWQPMAELTTDCVVGRECVRLILTARRFERGMADVTDTRHTAVDWFQVYRQMMVYLYG